jgi:hypothetical protein
MRETNFMFPSFSSCWRDQINGLDTRLRHRVWLPELDGGEVEVAEVAVGSAFVDQDRA